MVNENITGLLKMINELGFPKNIGERLGEEEKLRFFDLLIEEDVERAYMLGKDNNCEELLRKAGDTLFDKNSLTALSNSGYGFPDDNRLRKKAAWKVVDTHPLAAYEAGVKLDDNDLIKRAGWRLLETDDSFVESERFGIDYMVRLAFHAGMKIGDQDLTQRVGERMLDINPVTAYGLARFAEDKNLSQKAKENMLDRNNRIDLKSAYTEVRKANDQELLREIRKRFATNDPTEAYYVGKSWHHIVEELKGEDHALMELAREGYAKASPLKAFKEPGKDWKLLNGAGWNLLDIDPAKAYEAGKQTLDDELVKKAAWKLIDSDPHTAYKAGAKIQDKELSLSAGDKLLQSDPIKAYHTASRLGDNQLSKKAITKIAEDIRFDKSLLTKLYA